MSEGFEPAGGADPPWQQVAIEAIEQGVVLIDEHGVVRHANTAARRLLNDPVAPGGSMTEIAGFTVHDESGAVVPPERFASAVALRQRVAAEHRVEIRRRDGSSLWIMARAWPATYEGRPAAVTTFTDVSDQKRAEDLLRAGEGRLQAILDATPAVIYTKDLDGRFTLVNREFERMFHRSREDLLGRTDMDLMPAAVAAEVQANDRALIAGGVPVTYTERVPRDGEDRLWASVKVPLRDATGAVNGLAGVSTDITEQVRSAQAAALAAAVVDSTSDPIVTFDRDLFVTSLNPAAAQANQMEDASDQRRHMLEVFASYPEHEAFRRTLRAVLGGATVDWEVTFEEGPMGGRTFAARAFPLPLESGEVLSGVVMGRDITQMRNAEEERLRLQRELDHLHRLESLGQLAGGVAHDFNNLLGAIHLSAELLSRRVPQGAPERELVEQILAITARGVSLTRQMLVFARREPRRHDVVDLNDIVRRADQLLAPALGAAIDKVLDLSSEPLLVEGDAAQLEQVVVNLALNARDAMPGGGALTIGTGRVRITSDDAGRFGDSVVPGEHAVLSVVDDGSGMDGPTLTHAMEPFFTTKPTGKGTGLGLSMVFGVAGQAGGGVALESQPGSGTTVRVYLPLSHRLLKPEPDGPPEPERGQGELVLVVEDSPDLRSLVEELLRQAGYEVRAYADAETALAHAHRDQPRLLVTDVVMPGMTGPQLAAELRRLHPELRVLLVSGYSGEHRHGTSATDPRRPAPQDRLLEKPFTAAALLRTVREVLDDSDRG